MLSQVLEKMRKVAWFLPGFLLWASFPPMAETADCVFALAPLMWISRKGDCRKSAKCWFQSGIFFWVATLSWMPAIVKNGGPWPLVVLGWAALALYCSLYFAAYGWLSAGYWAWAAEKRAWARVIGLLLVEPVLWSGLELVRSRLFGGFAWNHLGVVPANSGFGAPAAVGGVYLLSAVVVIVNGVLAGIFERIALMAFRRKIDRWRSLETILGLAAVAAIYFACELIAPPEPKTVRRVKVAMVQRNFPCCFRDQDQDPLSVYDSLLANLSPLKADLVVLPESAMSEFGPVDGMRALSFAKRMCFANGGAQLLAGGSRTSGENEVFNSAALYTPGEGGAFSLDVYDKVHLVPFGEYIPGDKMFPYLQKFAPVGSCSAGDPKLLYLDDPRAPFATAICFEDTDSALIRKFAAMGAKFLVFITNDSWFSHSSETLQHAWQSVARAIETGLPVIRVGNSGVTGTLAPDGKVSWALDSDLRPAVDRSCTMFDRIEIAGDGESPAKTWYVVWGDVPLATVFVLLILIMILVKYKNHYEKRRYLSM